MFKVIVRSFWQIQSDPAGFKEIVKSKLFSKQSSFLIRWMVSDDHQACHLDLSSDPLDATLLLARLTEYLAVDVDLLLNLLFSLGMHSSSICCLARGGIQSHTSSTSVPPNITTIHPPWQLPSSIIFKVIFCYLQFVKVHSDRDFIGWTITMYLKNNISERIASLLKHSHHIW